MVFEGDLLKDYKLDFKDDKLVKVELPSVEERKKGKWIVNESGTPYCSECNSFQFGGHYCPNCGAKMVEPQESEETDI